LIDAAIRNFEEQTSQSARAQHARALYKKAIAFEAEGNKRRARIAIGGARSALEDLYEDAGSMKIAPAELSMNLFEQEIPFGFR
jgi:hypothetical protein